MRRMSRVLVVGCALSFASGAAAQTKFVGKVTQGKPDPSHVITVDDRPHHAMALVKVTATWSSGDINGDALKEEIDTAASDMIGAKTHEHGYGVGTTASGDKYFVRFEGTTNYKGETPVGSTCTWSFTGGTGKLVGLTGKGTCTGTFDATGAATFDVVGEYSIAPPKAK